MSHKSGFVNIIGNPNAGKSTLLNALMGEQLAITTPRAQTTRHRIMAFYNTEDVQIVLSDTPGYIADPSYKLHHSMLKVVDSAFLDADVLLLIVEPKQRDIDEKLLLKINQAGVPLIVLINKIDLSDQKGIEVDLSHWLHIFPSANVLPASALHNFNLEKVLQIMIDLLPEHPPYFPKDEITNRYMRFFISEILRGQILHIYQKEIPYSVEVVIDEYKESEEMDRIQATLFVMREGQRAIVLGNNGHMIKRLGTLARREMEAFIGKKVFIGITVKVKENWRDDENALHQFGYE